LSGFNPTKTNEASGGDPHHADDVVIFCLLDRAELLMVQELLAFFRHASGLETNFAKYSVSPIACLEDEAIEATGVMGPSGSSGYFSQ
jgi:hypothetical protein